MEKDAQSADKYKADVYSMAKTIWIILTGDEFSFGGQYIANSEIGLSRKLKCDKYLYPLDKLLAQCTDYAEITCPTTEEMKNKFEEWIQINANWNIENLIQWQEIQEQMFPTIIPTHAEWNYFLLETENLDPITSDFSQQDDNGYTEEVHEISPAQYISLEEFDNMSKADIDTFKPRYVCRNLKGSFVFFHKDSAYNKSVSKYKGEHDKMSSDIFHNTIVKYAKTYHKG